MQQVNFKKRVLNEYEKYRDKIPRRYRYSLF